MRRIYLNIWPRRRVTPAMLNLGMFYVTRNERLPILGYQDKGGTHELAISEVAYTELTKVGRSFAARLKKLHQSFRPRE